VTRGSRLRVPLRQAAAHLAKLAACHLARQASTLLAWAALGTAAWGGGTAPAARAAWALLLLGQAPLQALEADLTARLAVASGVWLRRTRLAAALAKPHAAGIVGIVGSAGIVGNIGIADSAGSTGPLAQALEVEAAEARGVEGAIAAVPALLALAVAATLLTLSAAAASATDPLASWRAPLLAVWTLAAGLAAWRQIVRHRARAARRRASLGDLGEALAGHRTRTVQQPPPCRHRQDDANLAANLRLARPVDRGAAWLQAGLSRAWLVTSPAACSPPTPSPASARPRPISPRPPAPGRPSRRCSTPTSRASSAYPASSTGTVAIHRAPLRPSDGDAPAPRGAHPRGARLCACRASRAITSSPTAWRSTSSARRWPPTAADRRDAARLCREIGLGALLDRLPAGLDERVGETGWSLSAGERSRVFLARAVLQNSAELVADEPLAALDPDSALAVLACLERARRSRRTPRAAPLPLY
jgi:hypothetical protein